MRFLDKLALKQDDNEISIINAINVSILESQPTSNYDDMDNSVSK